MLMAMDSSVEYHSKATLLQGKSLNATLDEGKADARAQCAVAKHPPPNFLNSDWGCCILTTVSKSRPSKAISLNNTGL